eukprot:3329276-Alexandrium_andersonii.AAC.1
MDAAVQCDLIGGPDSRPSKIMRSAIAATAEAAAAAKEAMEVAMEAQGHREYTASSARSSTGINSSSGG